MAFCPTCGASVEGRFCAKCGSAVGGSAPPPGAAPAGAYGAPAATAGGLTDNTASALCYLAGFITGILFLVIAPYNQNKTVRFHAFQSIFLNVAWIALWICMNIIFGILGRFVGFWILATLTPLISLAFFVLWILMMVWAYQGKKVVLPVIGNLAQQQA